MGVLGHGSCILGDLISFVQPSCTCVVYPGCELVRAAEKRKSDRAYSCIYISYLRESAGRVARAGGTGLFTFDNTLTIYPRKRSICAHMARADREGIALDGPEPIGLPLGPYHPLHNAGSATQSHPSRPPAAHEVNRTSGFAACRGQTASF